MAYEPTTWTDGDLITAAKLNKLEQGVQNEQVGPKGPAGATGADGKSVKAIELTTTAGQVTGGTCTLSDDSTIPITVTSSEG